MCSGYHSPGLLIIGKSPIQNKMITCTVSKGVSRQTTRGYEALPNSKPYSLKIFKE